MILYKISLYPYSDGRKFDRPLNNILEQSGFSSEFRRLNFEPSSLALSIFEVFSNFADVFLGFFENLFYAML